MFRFRKPSTWLVPLALIAITIGGCSKSANQDAAIQAEAKQHVERAESYRRQGQYRAAIIEARNAIKLAPNDVGNTVELAELFNDLGQGRQAIKLLEPLATGSDTRVVYALSEAYLVQGKYESAHNYLQAAQLRLHLENDDKLRFADARAQAGLGDYAAATKTLESLQDAADIGARAQLNLANIAFAQGQDENGERILQDLLQKNPNDIDALISAAAQAERAQKLDQAEDHLSKALMNLRQTDILLPQKITVLERLSTIVTKQGRSGEALVYSKALSDANPEGALLQEKFKQGLELFQAEKLDEAEAIFNEIYQQSHNETAGVLLGMIKYAKNDLAGAADFLGEHLDPEVAPDAALLALASAQLRMDQPAKLLALIGPEERAHLKNPQMKVLVGIALIQTGDIAAGGKLITEAQAEQPDNNAIRSTLARHYLISGEPQNAIALLEKGLAKNPNDPSLKRMLIRTYMEAGKTEQALTSAQALANSEPAQAENYLLYGHLALLTKHYDTSANALQKALALRPDLVGAQMDLAQLQLIQQQPEKAQAIYRSLIRKDADNAEALKGFVTAQEMLTDTNDTIAHIEQLLTSEANSNTVHAVIAEYYLRHQRLADAERLLAPINSDSGNQYAYFVKQLYAVAAASKALAAADYNTARLHVIAGLNINPRNQDLLALLATIEIKAQQPKEAEKVIAHLAALQPKSLAVIDLKGDLAAAEKQWDNASANYRQVWQATKKDGAALKLYKALAASNADSAQTFLTEWRESNPQSEQPYIVQAALAQQQGDKAAAIHAYEAAIARNANNPASLNNLALLYQEKGDERALTTAEKAYQLVPNNPVVLDTYGWLLANNRQIAKGIALLEQATTLAPDAKEIAEHLRQAKQKH